MQAAVTLRQTLEIVGIEMNKIATRITEKKQVLSHASHGNG